MDTLLKDIRYAVRGLVKRPAFAAIVIVTLALGIGANTAIFSVVNSVLLRPLPYKDPARLVMIHEGKDGNSWTTTGYDEFNDFRNRQQSFEQMAAFSAPWIFNLTGAGEPVQLNGQWVSGSLLSMLGVAPIEGRDFADGEDKAGAQPGVVILSYGLWQRQFGGRKTVIGQPINLDSTSYTVIGIAPPNFKIGEESDLWVPLALNPLNSRGRLIRYLSVMGRLKQNTALTEAQSDLALIARQLEQQYPDTNKGFGVHLTSLHEEVVGKVKPALLVLLGAVAFVLLIACANVANLTLARAIARRKEFAIRSTLGAGRKRLMRQLLTESVILSLLGGAGGLFLATWGIQLLLSLSPESVPRHEEIGVDARVLLFTLSVSLLTGIVCGLVPAWKAAKSDLNETLKESGQLQGSSARQHRFQSALIVSQIALALVLLTGSALLIKSFARLLNVNTGFDTENVLALQLTLPSQKYSQAPLRAALYQQLEQRLSALPGVKAVGAVSRMPLFAGDNPGRSNITSTIVVEGHSVAQADLPEADYRVASPSYFAAMNIPLVKGRLFNWQDEPRDNTGRPLTVVVNEAMARRFWPGEDAVGKHIKWGASSASDPWWTIVGVVGNVRHLRLDLEPHAEVYRPYLVNPLISPIVVVRTGSNPATLAAAVRNEVRALDKDIPLSSVSTMPQLISRSVAPRRFSMLLLAVFAGVALVLATVGIYGVMSYSVTQRTHEIGIRMALGAQARDVLKLVLRAGLGLTLIGVAGGLVSAFVLTRWMATLLFGVTPTDTATFVIVPLVLTAVALLACLIPARRAARVDPLVALRYE